MLLITAAMEMHPDDDDLLEIGAQALGKFATLKDLMHAMHTIARSRMEEQGTSTMANTAKVRCQYVCFRRHQFELTL